MVLLCLEIELEERFSGAEVTTSFSAIDCVKTDAFRGIDCSFHSKNGGAVTKNLKLVWKCVSFWDNNMDELGYNRTEAITEL